MTVDDKDHLFDLRAILAMTHGLPCSLDDHLTLQRHIIQRSPSTGMWVPECAEWLLEQHPQLRDVPAVPEFRGDEAAMTAWSDQQKALLGVDSLPVSPLPVDRRPDSTAFDFRSAVLDAHPHPSRIWMVE